MANCCAFQMLQSQRGRGCKEGFGFQKDKSLDGNEISAVHQVGESTEEKEGDERWGESPARDWFWYTGFGCSW